VAYGTRLGKQMPSPRTIEERPRLLIRMWDGWKHFAKMVGDFQARVILTVIYFLLVAPYAVIVRAVSDPLRTKSGARASMWQGKAAERISLETARRQF